jgi:hypothetical protein
VYCSMCDVVYWQARKHAGKMSHSHSTSAIAAIDALANVERIVTVRAVRLCVCVIALRARTHADGRQEGVRRVTDQYHTASRRDSARARAHATRHRSPALDAERLGCQCARGHCAQCTA